MHAPQIGTPLKEGKSAVIVDDASTALRVPGVLLLAGVMVMGTETVPLTENDVTTLRRLDVDLEDDDLADDVGVAVPELVDCARVNEQSDRINSKRV